MRNGPSREVETAHLTLRTNSEDSVLYSERQRRDDLNFLGRVEFLNAKRDDTGAFVDAAADQDVVALVGLHGHRLWRDRSGLGIRNIQLRSRALVEQRREWKPRDAFGFVLGQGQRGRHAELHIVANSGQGKLGL